ncbi:hypothetical protein PQX77_001140, partial [Marasmius sp. AFHP31]
KHTKLVYTTVTLDTGSVTALWSIVDIAVFFCVPTGLHLAFNFPLSELHIISLLSSLNARTHPQSDTQGSASLDASATSSDPERKVVRLSVPQIDFLDPRKWVGRGSGGSDFTSSDRNSSFDSRGSMSQAETASADKKGLTGIAKALREYGQIGRGVGASTSLRSAGAPKMRSFNYTV